MRNNNAGEATARDGANSHVEEANDEFDDEEQDGVESDLDLNKMVRTEAGERSCERLLIGKFYGPRRRRLQAVLLVGFQMDRALAWRGGGLMNAGAAGEAPRMLSVTPGARRAASKNFRKT